MSLASPNLGHLKPRSLRPFLKTLPDGRLQFTYRENIPDGWAIDNKEIFPWGTPFPDAEGVRLTPSLSKFADLRLIDGQEALHARDGAWVWERIYETMPATDEILIGRLTRETDDTGRDILVGDFRQLSAPVTAGAFVVGGNYTITALGTTDFTLIGAASNAVGVSFTATGPGAGTGVCVPQAVRGAEGVTTAPGRPDCVLDNEHSEDNGTVRSIRRIYLQATSTLTAIGKPTIRKASDDAFKITGATFYPAMEFIQPYLVAAGSLGVAGRVAYNTPYFPQVAATALVAGKTYTIDSVPAGTDFTTAGAAANTVDLTFVATGAGTGTGLAHEGDAYQRYLTDEEVAHKGLVTATVTRVWTELPSVFTYQLEEKFNYPGLLGAFPPATRTVAATITESYTLGQPTRAALGYDLQQYATVTINAQVSGDAASTQTTRERPGYLSGGWGLTAANSTIDGIKYTTYVATSTSVPENYPAAGPQIVSSQPELWRGMIWRLRNKAIPF